ncbi:MAG TPA: dihydropteroate synthase [Nocardioidaceae bacterium]|nr:dihydropteroate synthase [Nocardioidaceae bacterium]
MVDTADLMKPGRCLVMGVLNVTPDSFSDGGEWLAAGAAIEHGRQMAADGADLVDVGGESTRPGAQRASVDEELSRIIPVVRQLTADGIVVSIDTMRAEVAEQAVDAGARVINDVSGGRADPGMFAVVANANVPYVLMHWRRHSDAMDDEAHYDDVVAEVIAELRPQVEAALAAGISPEQLVIDPGLGFSKQPEHNWALLRRLDELLALGHPVLIGASRKRFIGSLLAVDPDQPRPAAERDDATTAITALVAAAGAWCVRVHEVRPNADAVRVVQRWSDG